MDNDENATLHRACRPAATLFHSRVPWRSLVHAVVHGIWQIQSPKVGFGRRPDTHFISAISVKLSAGLAETVHCISHMGKSHWSNSGQLTRIGILAKTSPDKGPSFRDVPMAPFGAISVQELKRRRLLRMQTTALDS